MRARLDAHAGQSVAMSRDNFFVSLLLTIRTLAWGRVLQRAFRQRSASQLQRKHKFQVAPPQSPFVIRSFDIVNDAATHRVASLASHHLRCQTHCEVAGSQASPRSA